MLECKRCSHVWEQRNLDRLPKVCPNPECKSTYWQKELTPYWEGIRENNRRLKIKKELTPYRNGLREKNRNEKMREKLIEKVNNLTRKQKFNFHTLYRCELQDIPEVGLKWALRKCDEVSKLGN